MISDGENISMKKLLITGASGFLGWNLCRIARSEWDVFGVCFRNESRVEGVKLVKTDLARTEEIRRLLIEIRPQAVIHTAAVSQTNYCQQNPEQSYRINVSATSDMAGLCAEMSIPFIFTSSDMVFDGLHPPYREDDPVCPVSIYGEQKVQAEKAVLQQHPDAVVCRMALMFGDVGPGAASFIQPWIAAMMEGRELKLFTDEYRTALSARDASRGILLALEEAKGLLHLGGPERLSRFEFAKVLRDLLGASTARLIACTQKDVPMSAPRPPDVSLDSSKAFALGFSPGTTREELRTLKAIHRRDAESAEKTT
jgi:dTDP-4-dehydrorhamnose reductase